MYVYGVKLIVKLTSKSGFLKGCSMDPLCTNRRAEYLIQLSVKSPDFLYSPMGLKSKLLKNLQGHAGPSSVNFKGPDAILRAIGLRASLISTFDDDNLLLFIGISVLCRYSHQ